MARRDDLKRLITIQSRRLQKLKEKEARKGVNVEVDDLIEIEDIEAKLEALQAELEQLEAEPEPEELGRSRSLGTARRLTRGRAVDWRSGR